MVNKPMLFFVCLIVLAIAACSSEDSSVADSSSEIEDYMLIQNDVYQNRKMGPVKFTHDAHWEFYGIFCEDCHHEYVDGENVWTEDDPVKPCVSCHMPGKAQGEVYKLSTAYHKNCRTCHRMMNEEGEEEVAPFACYSCHEKKNSD
ncbi:MAG: cytochrome c3 family protein [Desulfobacteraceae bacterium]